MFELQACYQRLSPLGPVQVSASLTAVMSEDGQDLQEILILELFPGVCEKDISQLKAQTSSYQSLIGDQVDVVVQLTPGLLFSFVSPSCAAAWGCRAEDLLAKSIWTIVHPDDIPSFDADLSSATCSKTAGLKRTYRRVTGDVNTPYVREEVNIVPVMKGGALAHYNLLSRLVEIPCYDSSSSWSSSSSSCSSLSGSEDDWSFSAPSTPRSAPTSPATEAFAASAPAAKPRKTRDPRPKNRTTSTSSSSSSSFPPASKRTSSHVVPSADLNDKADTRVASWEASSFLHHGVHASGDSKNLLQLYPQPLDLDLASSPLSCDSDDSFPSHHQYSSSSTSASPSPSEEMPSRKRAFDEMNPYPTDLCNNSRDWSGMDHFQKQGEETGDLEFDLGLNHAW